MLTSNLVVDSYSLVVSYVVQECKEILENSLVDGNPQKSGFVFGKLKCLTAKKGIWRKLGQ